MHFQTMLKTKLNVLTLRKEPLPTVIFHEPEAIELCTTTPLMKTRNHTGCKVDIDEFLENISHHKNGSQSIWLSPLVLFKMKKNMVSDIRVGVVTYGQMAFFLTELERRHPSAISVEEISAADIRNGERVACPSLWSGQELCCALLPKRMICPRGLTGSSGKPKVTYLGKVSTTGMQFLSGCTEKPVIELWKKHTLAREDIYPANALLEIRPFQVWLHHLDLKGEATVHMDTFQVARIAYCTADHNVSPNIFAWVYREINDDLSYQMDCHAVECESKLEAKKLAHAMMEAFKKTFHSMKSDGRIHRNSSSEEMSHEFESDDG
ncbi:Pid1 [Columba livia]|nr:Pid1 [Columba livia]